MLQEKKIIEFITNEGVDIKLIKRNNKYNIIVTEEKKKVNQRKVFESLNTELSMKQFFKICNFFTKDLK